MMMPQTWLVVRRFRVSGNGLVELGYRCRHENPLGPAKPPSMPRLKEFR